MGCLGLPCSGGGSGLGGLQLHFASLCMLSHVFRAGSGIFHQGASGSELSWESGALCVLQTHGTLLSFLAWWRLALWFAGVSYLFCSCASGLHALGEIFLSWCVSSFCRLAAWYSGKAQVPLEEGIVFTAAVKQLLCTWPKSRVSPESSPSSASLALAFLAVPTHSGQKQGEEVAGGYRLVLPLRLLDF